MVESWLKVALSGGVVIDTLGSREARTVNRFAGETYVCPAVSVACARTWKMPGTAPFQVKLKGWTLVSPNSCSPRMNVIPAILPLSPVTPAWMITESGAIRVSPCMGWVMVTTTPGSVESGAAIFQLP